MLHNFALDMNWLLGSVLANAKWPKVKYPPKRAITEEEHHRICAREPNPERRAFYGVLWHTGASHTDAAFMEPSNVDLQDKLLTYHRRKTREPAQIEIGPELEATHHRGADDAQNIAKLAMRILPWLESRATSTTTDEHLQAGWASRQP